MNKKKIVLSFDPKSIFFGMVCGLILGYLVTLSYSSPEKQDKTNIGSLPEGHPPLEEGSEAGMPILDEATAQQMNEYKQELDSWKARWEEDHANWMAALKVADMYYEVQFYDRSIPWYQKSLEHNNVRETRNDMAFAQFMAGISKRQSGSFEDSDIFIADSINTLESLLEDYPDYPTAWLTYGFVMVNTGKADIAKDAFSKCSELDPLGPVGDEARAFLEQIKNNG